ncbi:hypothetical protein T9A_00639 [Alcanivorax jadensis T9]|uniref:Uncharacterized protein n=1 Tax=Alcanivorax jadensis T9 TaxID=1177181 RepID=A0ABR4WG88_9GAMM|nr:hypothetical protein T9A_00639 [Alcanivorax jadensis T9]
MGRIVCKILIVDIHFQDLIADTDATWSPPSWRMLIIFAQDVDKQIQGLPFIRGIGTKPVAGHSTILARCNTSRSTQRNTDAPCLLT